MSVNIGVHQTCVGMDFDYGRKGMVVINMIGYINDAVQEFPDMPSTKVKTPAGINLFEIDETGECS